MYSSMDEDEGYDESSVVSSMLWVRNLRRYIRSDAGLGSEAMMGIVKVLINYPQIFLVNLYSPLNA